MFSPGTQENNDWAEERKDWAEEKEKDLKIAQLQQHLEAQAIQVWCPGHLGMVPRPSRYGAQAT